MSIKTLHSLVTGYMLLPTDQQFPFYRGVDRDPFQPQILDHEIDIDACAPSASLRIWEMYPSGWRRDSYRIFEDNMAESSLDDFFVLCNHEAARTIQEIIQPHVGLHEICEVTVYPVQLQGIIQPQESDADSTFLGYDIAYPGGDYYSAIKNGLLIPRSDRIAVDNRQAPFCRYSSLVNQYGLFSDVNYVSDYTTYFRTIAPSEFQSIFVVYKVKVDK